MKIKGMFIYILCALIIFQDALSKVIPSSIITYTDEMVVVFLLIKAFLQVLHKRKKINKLSVKLFYMITIFSFIGIYSCYKNSEFILKNVLLSNFLSVKFLLLIIALVNIGIKESTVDYIKKVVIFYSKLVMIFAVINLIMPNVYTKVFTYLTVTYRFGVPAVCSLFTHPGTYGWFMLSVALYHYSSYLSRNEKKDFKSFIVASIFAILSFRVKVIIGLICVLIYTAFMKNRISSKKVILAIAVTTIILISTRSLLINTYYTYFTSQYGVSARQSLTINSINIAKDYFPIGVGLGKFGSWYARINYSEHYYLYNMIFVYGLNPSNPFFATDTYWPSVIGEVGVLGTIIFIIMIISIYKELKRKKNIDSENVIIMWSILTVIQSLIESTSEQILNNAPQYVIIAVILSLGLSENIMQPKEELLCKK